MNWLTYLISLLPLVFKQKAITIMDKTPSETPQNAPETTEQVQPNPPTNLDGTDQLYDDWSDPHKARHNVRALCDLEGLTLQEKNDLCATLACESGFKIDIVHPNYSWVGGVRHVASTDYGICQWNDYYHGKEITPDEALHDPEKAVRLMCKYWKQGLGRQWVCYSSGLYKRQ